MKSISSLNAPFGARCFRTFSLVEPEQGLLGDVLMHRFGARCFLTKEAHHTNTGSAAVLMLLMVLGAF